jgi:hypothetical protein
MILSHNSTYPWTSLASRYNIVMSNDTPITVKVDSWYEYIRKHPDFTGCIISKFGAKQWYKNGKRHRTDGPAINYASGDKDWYLNGLRLTEQEHRLKVRQMKMKLIDTMKHSL